MLSLLFAEIPEQTVNNNNNNYIRKIHDLKIIQHYKLFQYQIQPFRRHTNISNMNSIKHLFFKKNAIGWIRYAGNSSQIQPQIISYQEARVNENLNSFISRYQF